MSAATILTGLYPPAVRERWGADLRREVSASGVRSWPDTLAGAARLWLHPGDWPETFAGQTRRVLTVTLFAMAAATGLLLRTVTPSAGLTAGIDRPATSAWLVPLALGIILAAPFPPLRGDALARLLGVAIRTLALPAAAVLAMISLAWSGAVEHVTGIADAAMMLYYWLTLGFVALRLCTLVARAARIAVLPTARRVAAALLCLGTGLALAAGQSLITASPHPVSITQALALGLLAATAISAGLDLRRKTV